MCGFARVYCMIPVPWPRGSTAKCRAVDCRVMGAGRKAKNNPRVYFTCSKAHAMIPVMTPILDDIRKAIDASDKSRYRISKETGISESRLCQLMGGTKGLSIEALELLVDCLNLEVKICPKGRKKGR